MEDVDWVVVLLRCNAGATRYRLHDGGERVADEPPCTTLLPEAMTLPARWQ